VINVFTVIGSVVQAVFGTIVSFISAWIQTIIAIFTGNFEVIQGIWSTFLINVQTLWSDSWTTISTVLINAWNIIVTTITTKLTEFVNLIKTKLEEGKKWFEDLKTSIIEKVTSIDLASAGVQIIQSLINGITSMAGEVAKAVGNIANSIKDGIGGAISSGSKSIRTISIGNNSKGTMNWQGGLTTVAELGREFIRLPDGQAFIANALSLLNLPRGTQIYNNQDTEKMLGNNFSQPNLKLPNFAPSSVSTRNINQSNVNETNNNTTNIYNEPAQDRLVFGPKLKFSNSF
jgi:phage-related protein